MTSFVSTLRERSAVLPVIRGVMGVALMGPTTVRNARRAGARTRTVSASTIT